MSKKNGLGKFLLGAGIGVGVGMLFSKKSGKENREALKQKASELVETLKNIDSEEVRENVSKKVNQLMEEISNMDKEKALKIAKKQAENIKTCAEDLVEYVVDKGTPVLEKTADALRVKAIEVTKQILNKLESEQE